MLRAAIMFFVLALVAYFLGAAGIAGLSMEIGRILIFAFLILGAISLTAHLITGRGAPRGLS